MTVVCTLLICCIDLGLLRDQLILALMQKSFFRLLHAVFSQSGYCKIFGGVYGIFEGGLGKLHFEFHQAQPSQDNEDKKSTCANAVTADQDWQEGRKAGWLGGQGGQGGVVGWCRWRRGGQGLVAGPVRWRARQGGWPGGWRGMDLQSKEFSLVNIKT